VGARVNGGIRTAKPTDVKIAPPTRRGALQAQLAAVADVVAGLD
jgi:hypothetical protein